MASRRWWLPLFLLLLVLAPATPAQTDDWTVLHVVDGDTIHVQRGADLEKVRYIDSTGLGVLIGGLKRVREHGGTVNLVCTNPQIKKIFDITGLVKIFGIYDTETQACESL